MKAMEKKWMLGCFAVLGLGLVTARGAAAEGKAKLSETLAATVDAPDKASGKANLNLRPRKNRGTKGSFTIRAKHLSPDTAYDLIVGGSKVGELTTGRAGGGRATFSTRPRGKASLLGFDPRGETVVLRDGATGSDDLVGTIPDDSPGSQACCLATGQTEDNGSAETECEDLDAQACQTAGGTPQWVLNSDGTPSQTPVTSCLPDPCNNTTSAPPSSVAVACCINTTHDEGTESECEDYTEAACAAAGGLLVQVPGVTPGEGNPCDTNPCLATPLPPSTPPALCCVPHTMSSGEPEPPECEDLTAAACTAVGGVPPSNGSCDYSTPVPCP